MFRLFVSLASSSLYVSYCHWLFQFRSREKRMFGGLCFCVTTRMFLVRSCSLTFRLVLRSRVSASLPIADIIERNSRDRRVNDREIDSDQHDRDRLSRKGIRVGSRSSVSIIEHDRCYDGKIYLKSCTCQFSGSLLELTDIFERRRTNIMSKYRIIFDTSNKWWHKQSSKINSRSIWILCRTRKIMSEYFSAPYSIFNCILHFPFYTKKISDKCRYLSLHTITNFAATF